MMHDNNNNGEISSHRRTLSHPVPSTGSGFSRRNDERNDRGATVVSMDFELNSDGIVMTREQIIERRMKRGECLTCPAFPTQCFEIKRSMYSPIMNTKVPRTADGIVYKGWCLLCHPDKNPKKKKKRRTSRRTTLTEPRLAREGQSAIQPDENFSRSENLQTSTTPPPTSTDRPRSTSSIEQRGLGRASLMSRQGAMRMTVTENAPATRRGRMTPQRSMPLIAANGLSDDEDDNDNDSDSEIQLETETKQEIDSDEKDESISDFVADWGVQMEDTNDTPNQSHSTLNTENGQSESLTNNQSESSTKVVRNYKQPSVEQAITPSIEDEEKLQNLQGFIAALSPPGEESSENDGAVIDTVSNYLLDELDAHTSDGARLPSVNLAAFCVTKVWEFARKSDVNKDSIVYSNGLDAIIQAMFVYAKKDSTIQERGCGALWSLAVRPRNRSAIALAGGCHRVIDAMSNHISSERVQTMGLGAIKALSADRDGRASLESRGASRVIVRTMKANVKNSSIQAEGCGVLSNLAVDIGTNQVSVAKTDEMLTILAAMSAHTTKPDVQKMAIFVMKNYTFSEKNVETLSRCPDANKMILWASKQYPMQCGDDAKVVLDRLKQFEQQQQKRLSSFAAGSLIEDSEQIEKENAAHESLMRLSFGSCSDAETINGVVDIMMEWPLSVKIQSSGLQSLWLLSRKKDSENAGTIAESPRALDAIFSSMSGQSFSHDSDTINILERGCGIILSLAESGPINRLRLIHHPKDACAEALWNAIERYVAEESVQAMALGACRALLAEEDFCNVSKKTDGLRLMALAMRVHPSSRKIQREGKMIMMRLQDHMSSRNFGDRSQDGTVEEINVLLDTLTTNVQE